MFEPQYDEYEFRSAIVDGSPGLIQFPSRPVPGRGDLATERSDDLHTGGGTIDVEESFVIEILSFGAEYDRLMGSIKWTINDVQRVKHLEDHIADNEIVCRCGKDT